MPSRAPTSCFWLVASSASRQARRNSPRSTALRFCPCACDVTDEASIDAALAAADEKFGHVEVLVNCAGGEKGTGTKLVDFDRGDWDFTMNLDLSSVFTMTKKFAGYMAKNIEAGKQTYGRIINIASIYGLVGNTAIPTIAYHASKGAVVNFSRGAAAELAPLGITVNTICPGYFYTELTTETLDTEYFQNFAKSTVPMQRYGQSGELNAAAVFLGSEEASYVTGQAIAVDGGYTCVNRRLFMPQRFVDCAVFGCRNLMRQTQGNARSLFVCEKRTRSG